MKLTITIIFFIFNFYTFASEVSALTATSTSIYTDIDGDEIEVLDLKFGENIHKVVDILPTTVFDEEIIFDESFSGKAKEANKKKDAH